MTNMYEGELNYRSMCNNDRHSYSVHEMIMEHVRRKDGKGGGSGLQHMTPRSMGELEVNV